MTAGRNVRMIRRNEIEVGKSYTWQYISELPWDHLYKREYGDGDQIVGECITGDKYFFWHAAIDNPKDLYRSTVITPVKWTGGQLY